MSLKSWMLGLGAAVLAGAGGAAIYLWTPSGTAFDADAVRTAAAAYDARIIRDRFGVPHIHGARNADVAFGLAYAHAEDDWKHVEEVVRSNRGQLAEIQGQGAAVADYLIRALGNIDLVEAGYETGVSDQAKAVAAGYAAGVNLWCADNPDSGCARTAPVRPQDIIAGYANRPPFFYGLDGELNTLLNGEGPVEVAVKEARAAYLGTTEEVELGSNAIAVSPTRSSDGHTRLAVNSHQPYEGTVAWYEVRLKSDEGIDMVGGVFPGSPLILHGAGPSLGWAATVNRPDVFDVFKLTVDNESDPRQYQMDGAWKDLVRAPIRFRVKLWGPFSLPVTRKGYVSEHGPVFVTPRGVFAVSFAGRGELNYLDQYLAMNMAKTVGDWRAAQARYNAIPSINYVVADSQGSIAYFYNAHMPKRAEGWDRRKVLPGDTSETLWQGFEPVEALPAVINPASGYVVNANHTPFAASGPDDNPSLGSYPDAFGVDKQMTNRGLRAQELLGGDTSISREEFITYKMDHSYSPESNVRKMVADVVARGAGGDAELAGVLEVLSRWSGSADKANREAALPILAGQRAMGGQINQPYDYAKVVAALKEVAADLKAAHGRIDPEWGEVSRVARGDASWPTDGGPDTLRAVYAAGDLKTDKFLKGRAGDTYIVIADWAPDGAYRLSTIHQYGSATMDAASPHYADQAPLFAAGTFKEPPMSLDAVLAEKTRDYRPGRD
jgi:acyl-homoserine-lactone acylase